MMCQKNNKSSMTELVWRKWPHLVFVVILACVGFYLDQHLMLTESKSLANRFYWITDATSDHEPIKRWEYVVFRESHPFFHKGKTENYAKVVRCLPGDTLRTTEDRTFYCNNKLLGRAIVKSKTGRVTPVFVYNGVLPENKYFMLGEALASFDSRYFGLVDRDQITYRARPLF